MEEAEAISQFRGALRSAGLEMAEPLVADGRIHRFTVSGDRTSSRSAWYVLHLNPMRAPAGAFGCWRRGFKDVWSARPPASSKPSERDAFRRSAESSANEVREQLNAKARKTAAGIWRNASNPSAEHEYLARKRIGANGARLYKGSLIVPLCDMAGTIQSLQFISPAGQKRFLSGGRTAGCLVCLRGSQAALLYLAEGFATGATVHELTGASVVIAFSAHNIVPVARALRQANPEAKIVICADNDAWTQGNPGHRSADAAAEAVHGLVAIPEFVDSSSRPTDFNDLARLEGAEAVRRCLAKAIPIRPRPRIIVEPGRLPAMVDEAEQALMLNTERWPTYQRAGLLVRAAVIPQPRTDLGILRPPGTLLIMPMGKHCLRDQLTRAALWAKRIEIDGRIEYLEQDCPRAVAEVLLDRAGSWKITPLHGIIEAPTLRPDGSVLMTPGYDHATGLFFHSNLDWPSVPNAPTKEEALVALRCLCEPFKEFPFVGEEDRSVVLTAILTALLRRSLKTAPLIAFSSPTAGSGKGLLADSVSLIAVGRNAPAMPQGGNSEEELRKRITSILLAGDLVVNVDNIEHPLSGDSLCSALTQEFIQDRLLGQNKLAALRTNVLWLATGNNLTFSGDMVRRGLISRIDSGHERPDQRRFVVPDLRALVLSKRPQLVLAALTILRAYEAAGRPPQQIPPFGSFEDWSARVREPLVWLGQPDPCLTRERLVVEDPIRESIQNVLETIYAVASDNAFTLQDLVARVREPGSNSELHELREALYQVASRNGGNLDPRLLGWWCRKAVDRPVGGFKLVRLPEKRHGVQLWRVDADDQGGHPGHAGYSRPRSIPTNCSRSPEIFLGIQDNPPDPLTTQRQETV